MTALRRKWIAAGLIASELLCLALPPSGWRIVLLLPAGWLLGAFLGDVAVARARRKEH